MIHRILDEAQQEYDDAVAYLENRDAGLGTEFRVEVVDAIRKMLENPDGGTWLEEGYRYRTTKRFRYLVIYTIRESEIVIVAVMHESRRLGYWKGRVSEQEEE
jgi:plasmid stabilization system protein ParE